MGYSANAKSFNTLDKIRELLDTETSNGMPDGGFWEIGRENDDGAITGTVWKPWVKDLTRVVRRGSFRIDGDGKIIRFPGLSRELKSEAERLGNALFVATFHRE